MYARQVYRVAFLFLVLLIVVANASAQEVGKPFEGLVSFCGTKEEAVAILHTEKNEGVEKATEKFIASEACYNATIFFYIKGVVATVTTSRGKWTISEILVPISEKEAVVLYWFTRTHIQGYKEA